MLCLELPPRDTAEFDLEPDREQCTGDRADSVEGRRKIARPKSTRGNAGREGLRHTKARSEVVG